MFTKIAFVFVLIFSVSVLGNAQTSASNTQPAVPSTTLTSEERTRLGERVAMRALKEF